MGSPSSRRIGGRDLGDPQMVIYHAPGTWNVTTRTQVGLVEYEAPYFGVGLSTCSIITCDQNVPDDMTYGIVRATVPSSGRPISAAVL